MDTRLRDSVLTGDTPAVVATLESGGPVDALDRYGQTALMLAALHGHADLVDALIARGASLDVTAKYGLSALMLAVVNGHTQIATALIRAGADTTLRGSGAPGFAGKTAAALAADRGMPELG
jgi:hypothetical protein